MAKKKPNASSGNRSILLFASLLVLITFVLYIRITNHTFVNYDDDTLITSNRVVVDEKSSIGDCFTWNIFTPHFKPLVLLSWRAEYRLFGDTPGVFLFNNLLLHALNVLLVFILSITLLQKIIPDKRSQVNLAAFFIALMFAIHPLHVESVAWAVERKDVLYTFFFFLSWWAYIQYLEKNKYPFLLLSALFYLLVILTKSMGITLIAVVFLTDYLYGRRAYLSLLKEKIPLVLCFILGIYLYGLVNYFTAFFSGGVVGANSNIPETLRAASEANPILQIGLMAFLKVFLLLVHTILPLHISVIYEGAEIQKMIGVLFFIIPFLLLGLLFLAYRLKDKYKEVFFGLAFFLITVSPAIAIGKYGGIGVFAGDRYTYVPMLGMMLMIVVWVFRIPSTMKQLPIVLMLSISAFYLFITIPAIGVWKNPETLWTNAIEKTVCAAPAYNGRGAYYLDVTKETDKALQDFSQAIACDSTHWSALYNRGLILMNNNKKKEALKDLNKAIQLNPRYVEAYVNRGNILRDRNEHEAAMSDYNTAIQLSPAFSKSYFNRGSLFINLKRYDEAIQDNSKAISIDPMYAKAYYNRGLAYYNSSRKEEACRDFKIAMEQGYEVAAKTIRDHCQ